MNITSLLRSQCFRCITIYVCRHLYAAGMGLDAVLLLPSLCVVIVRISISAHAPHPTYLYSHKTEAVTVMCIKQIVKVNGNIIITVSRCIN